MAKIPSATIKQLMKEAGCERTSKGAVEQLKKIVEAYITDVSIEAKDLAEYNGRKTVLESDINFIC